MKVFLHEYGVTIFSAIVAILLILVLAPSSEYYSGFLVDTVKDSYAKEKNQLNAIKEDEEISYNGKETVIMSLPGGQTAEDVEFNQTETLTEDILITSSVAFSCKVFAQNDEEDVIDASFSDNQYSLVLQAKDYNEYIPFITGGNSETQYAITIKPSK